MIGVYMRSPSMTVEQYHLIDDKLREATDGKSPTGLMLHTCFGESEALAIFDIWNSQAEFEAMGPVLMPILAELGVEMSPPDFVEIVAFAVA